MLIDEALERLKAEVLAQDWRLNERRINALEDAFEAIAEMARSRKSFRYVLGMARGTLDYIKKHGDSSLPEALDFFKESLAHLVSMAEEDDPDPRREEEIFKLKGKVALRKTP